MASQAGGHEGPAIIPLKALRILVRICSQVPAKVQSALLVVCVKSLGEGRGSQKQTTHQKTKTKLSSATPNRDKTIHCQRKRRKKQPASNVAAESAPHPRHAAKACNNNTQTIPNNMVLWQRWTTWAVNTLAFWTPRSGPQCFKFNLAGTSTIVLYSFESRKPRFVLVPIRFASEAWPRPGLAEPRSTSIAGFGNTEPLSSTEQKAKDCHDQDKQVQGASFGFVFGT